MAKQQQHRLVELLFFSEAAVQLALGNAREQRTEQAMAVVRGIRWGTKKRGSPQLIARASPERATTHGLGCGATHDKNPVCVCVCVCMRVRGLPEAARFLTEGFPTKHGNPQGNSVFANGRGCFDSTIPFHAGQGSDQRCKERDSLLAGKDEGNPGWAGSGTVGARRLFFVDLQGGPLRHTCDSHGRQGWWTCLGGRQRLLIAQSETGRRLFGVAGWTPCASFEVTLERCRGG